MKSGAVQSIPRTGPSDSVKPLVQLVYSAFLLSLSESCSFKASRKATLPSCFQSAKVGHIRAENIERALPEGQGIEEVVADKGYHSRERMVDLEAVGLRSYVSEPRRGKRRWRGDRQGQKAVYANRRRIRGVRGQRLLRQRGKRLERPCAHLYGSGGMRRLHVRRRENVLKRLLIQVSAFNLGMLMRQHLGVGTPRGLQGRICALMLLILSLFKRLKGLFGLIPVARPKNPTQRPLCCFHRWILPELRKPASTTGC